MTSPRRCLRRAGLMAGRRLTSPSGSPFPLDRWPDVPTRILVGAEDRFFPVDFQRRVARTRLGRDVEVVPGGHLVALSHPAELTEHLVGLLDSPP